MNTSTNVHGELDTELSYYGEERGDRYGTLTITEPEEERNALSPMVTIFLRDPETCRKMAIQLVSLASWLDEQTETQRPKARR